MKFTLELDFHESFALRDALIRSICYARKRLAHEGNADAPSTADGWLGIIQKQSALYEKIYKAEETAK